jgi:type VI secretion system secreted protein VgrG
MKKFKLKKISIIALLAIFFVVSFVGILKAATYVNLGTADSFAVLAGSGITNTGATIITGDVGTFPTLTETGFGSITLTGTNHVGDGVTQTAKSDLITAYDDAAGQVATTVASELGGTTKIAGVYDTADGELHVTNTLTLDGGGDPDAIFIFKAGSTLTTSSGSTSHISLINSAQACNVFWQVGSSATIGTGSDFKGNILALSSITDDGGSTISGRLLARNAAVTLNNTTLTRATCTGAPVLTLVKAITNDNGGTALATDWTLVGTGPTIISGVTGSVAVTNAVVTAGTYTLTETSGPTGYTASTYSCVKNGLPAVISDSITLATSDTATCTINNNDDAVVSSSSSGTVYGCKDPNATNYDFFSSSKPELCEYLVVAPIAISTPIIVTPSLPKTGFAPLEEYSKWYSILFRNVLSCFQ